LGEGMASRPMSASMHGLPRGTADEPWHQM
jgi:hypothetical protein